MKACPRWFYLCLALSTALVLGACSGKRSPKPLDLDGGVADDGGGSGAAGTIGGGGRGGSAGHGGGGSGAAANGGGAGSGVDGGVLGAPNPGWTVPPSLQLCHNGPCQCADGIDNDGDGAADGFDTECTGPNDNDEGSFATGIPGDNKDPKWQDCFFDGNSGGGDDGCRYSTKCLTGELPQTDKDCVVAQHCIDFCKPRAPNGCDCFGCCAVRGDDGATVNVFLSSSCDASDLGSCTTCTPSTQCQNTCGECELCPGKTPADLPSSCAMPPPTAGTSGGSSGAGGSAGSGSAGSGSAGSGGSAPPPYVCDNGEDVCASNADCNGGSYCSFGCCLVIPPG